MIPRSRGTVCPRFAWNLPALSNRGRREDRVLAAPAVSRADCTKQSAHEHTGSAETLRPSLRNGFTAYIVLSPANGLLATVVPEQRWLPRNLTPPPRRQDHTTLPYAQAALVSRNSCVHRNPPRVRDDGRRPSEWDGMAKDMPLICPSDKAKYF